MAATFHMQQRNCIKCNLTKDASDFSYSLTTGTFSDICKECLEKSSQEYIELINMNTATINSYNYQINNINTDQIKEYITNVIRDAW